MKELVSKEVPSQDRNAVSQQIVQLQSHQEEYLPVVETTPIVTDLIEDFFFTFNKSGGDKKSIIRKLKYLLEEIEEGSDSARYDISVTVRGREV